MALAPDPGCPASEVCNTPRIRDRKVVYYQVTVERLSRPEAVQLLRDCLRTGTIIPGKHFRDELAKEGLNSSRRAAGA